MLQPLERQNSRSDRRVSPTLHRLRPRAGLQGQAGLGAVAYQLGNTSSRTITEVKQRWARLVLGWVTVQVSPECCC